MKLCWIDSYLDEDQRSCFMIVVGFWKILGVYFFLYTCDFCILGLITGQSLCCRIFVKSKIGVILIEK